MRYGCLCLVLLAGACAGPDDAGHQVGRALYDASVSTGHAVGVATDRTGQALQGAGANLRNAVSPSPPLAVAAPDLPPAYVPDGFPAQPPVDATPLPAPPGVRVAPSMGY